MAGEVFTIRPLQLYAVTQQLLQGKPTCANGDAKTDLGHILDFTCRLKYLKVSSVLNGCLCCQPSSQGVCCVMWSFQQCPLYRYNHKILLGARRDG